MRKQNWFTKKRTPILVTTRLAVMYSMYRVFANTEETVVGGVLFIALMILTVIVLLDFYDML